MDTPLSRRRLRDLGWERSLRINGALPSVTDPPPKEQGKLRRLQWFLKELFWNLPL
jgi:hypothetical protein